METVSLFIKWALVNGFLAEERKSENEPTLPDEVNKRFKNLPDDYKYFISKVKYLRNKNDNVWFLCEEDFLLKDDDGFCWNEFEKMSLEAAEGDDIITNDITKFWSFVLPVIMSVKNGYEYYGLDFSKKEPSIVMGCEPEFEECKVVAKSFSDLLQKIMNNKINIY